MSLKSLRKRVKEAFRLPVRIPRNALFYHRHRGLAGVEKIIYALTPPPRLRNIGDHAQAVAIHRWLSRHYPGIPVLELDKDQCRYYRFALERLAKPGDVIFLHSGGNLGDRAMWSEGIRRMLIQSFPHNRIVSLPQTIYFSDTPRGERERENTRRIYAAHPDLTVIGRDPESGALARELFPGAVTFCCPDYVLSLDPLAPRPPGNERRILACLRRDDESVFTDEDRAHLVETLPGDATVFDTTLAEPIPLDSRERILSETLDLFASHGIVVTDRYHGVIFSVLTGVPCCVLRTVDHKLTSALSWFAGMDGVTFVESVADLTDCIDSAAKTRMTVIDWNARYFDPLADILKGRRDPAELRPPEG